MKGSGTKEHNTFCQLQKQLITTALKRQRYLEKEFSLVTGKFYTLEAIENAKHLIQDHNINKKLPPVASFIC